MRKTAFPRFWSVRLSHGPILAGAIAVAALVGTAGALAQQPIGIDVSSYQGSINWSDVKSNGYTFAWAKATEGTFYQDAYFTANENNGKAAGVYIGAYHFAHPEEDVGTAGADAEAAYFWDFAKNYLNGNNVYLVPMLDFEVSYGSGSSMAAWINEWCQDIKNYGAANGNVINPVVYTDGSIANSLASSVTQWPLDIADPGYTDPQGDNPGVSISPWSTWTFWQYSTTGSVSGISGNVDEDIIDGTSSTLLKFLITSSGTSAGPGVNLYWDPGAKKATPGSGGSGNWNVGTSDWYLSGTGDVEWSASGDYAELSGSSGTVTLTAGVTANGITFDTAGYNVTGTSETITLAAPGNIVVPSGSATYIQCILGGVGFNLSGGGILVLNNSGNWSGNSSSAQYIIGPSTTLVVDSDHDVGNDVVTLNLQNGGIYQDNDSTSGDEFLLPGSAIALLTGGGTFDNPNADLTMTNYITGPGGLTIIGTTYTLTINNPTGNTYTGITAINSGQLQINADNDLGTAPSSAVANQITFNNGSPLRCAGSFTLNANRGITLGSGGGILYATQGSTLTYGGVITGSGGISYGSNVTTGYGTIVLSGASDYTGASTIACGTVQLGANNALPTATALTIEAANTVTGTLNMNGHSQTIGSLASGPGIAGTGTTAPSINLTGALTINGTSGASFGGIISGSGGSLTVEGSGSLTLTGVNTYSGATTVSGGATLSIAADSALGSTSAGLTLNGGCLKNDDSSPSLSSSRTVTLGANGGYIDAGWAPTNPITVNGKITGSGPLLINLDGSPVVLANSADNYTGDTDIGTNGPSYYSPGGQAWLKCGAAGVIPGGSGNGNVNIHGATYKGLLDLAGYSQTINGLSGDPAAVVNNSTGSSTFSVGNNNQTSAYNGVIENTGGTLTLSKAGTGTLTLGGVNTYSGNTSITAGTMALGSGGSINNSPTLSIAAGATFDVSAISSYALSGSTTLSAGGTASPATINGASGGTVSLGSQPIVLSYDGSHPALTISQGTLALNSNAFTVNGSQLPGGAAYTIVQQASGSISNSGTSSVSGTALGAPGTTPAISVVGGNVILTITESTGTTLNSLTPSTYGQSVTFTATIAPSPSGGTVQFYDNGVALGSPVSVSGGTASFMTSTLAVGNHPITASYTGTPGYAASATSGASTQQVSAASLSVTANPRSKVYGTFLAFASGSTNFASSGLQNSETIGSVTLAVSGNGGASNAPVGTYTITPSAATGGTFNATNYSITYFTNALTVTLPSNTIPVTIVGINLLGGNVQMSFSGTPGYVYYVEAATTLNPPIVWTTVSTNAADTNGSFSFTDTNANSYPYRYYRTSIQ